MKTFHGRNEVPFAFRCWLACCALALMACAPSGFAEEHTKGTRPAIYDEHADGAKQIGDAVGQAKKENKRVLVQFGANWCGWCHKLHGLFQTDAAVAKKLKTDYVVVMVDV